MAQPVLVKAYTSHTNPPSRYTRGSNSSKKPVQTLPPVASFAFADILRAADGPELQSAIDGIADICAKNRMSLADEYGAHLPPLGEITAANSSGSGPGSTIRVVRAHLSRPGMRTALTSVPEASSGSSEGGGGGSSSRRSGKQQQQRRGIFSFRRKQLESVKPLRRIRIGSMGRSVAVGSTTALAADLWQQDSEAAAGASLVCAVPPTLVSRERSSSDAAASLQRLLTNSSASTQPG